MSQHQAVLLRDPANPTMDIIDIRAVSDLAHEHGIEVAGQCRLQRPAAPMDFGADVVAYSATKLMDGQGRVLAGAVAPAMSGSTNICCPISATPGRSCRPSTPGWC
jgi:cystathionine beta-lyase/cystathionine gamma-synthase